MNILSDMYLKSFMMLISTSFKLVCTNRDVSVGHGVLIIFNNEKNWVCSYLWYVLHGSHTFAYQSLAYYMYYWKYDCFDIISSGPLLFCQTKNIYNL